MLSGLAGKVGAGVFAEVQRVLQILVPDIEIP